MEEEHNTSERDKLKDNLLLINKRNSLISGEDENEGNSNSIEKVK